jgi:hypothetical protein
VAAILDELLGLRTQRMLGAGRKEDVGDIAGVPETVVQVADWKDAPRAMREKPLEAERQRRNTYPRKTFAATFVRLRGGEYRVCLTPEQWATLYREAT